MSKLFPQLSFLDETETNRSFFQNSLMKLDISSTIYNPETTSALIRYQKHLHATRERLEEQRVLALEELNSYDMELKGSSGPLVDIARRYGGLIREMEDVSIEISRLEQ